MKKVCILLCSCFFFFLASCSYSPDVKKDIEEKAIDTNEIEVNQTQDIINIVEDTEPQLDIIYADINNALDNGKISEAREHFDKVQDKDSDGYIFIHGKVLFGEEKYEEAISEITKLEGKLEGMDSFDTIFLLGVLHDNLGNISTAKEYIKKALEIDPTSENALSYDKNLEGKETVNNIGANPVSSDIAELLSQGKYEESKKLLDIEDKQDPNRTEVFRLFALYYALVDSSEDSMKKSLEYIRKVESIEGWEKNKHLLYQYAFSLYINGEKEESKKYIEKALKLDPDFQLAKDYLATQY